MGGDGGEAIRAEGLGKRFARYDEARRPRTLKRLLSGDWRASRPLDRFWALREVGLGVGFGEMLGIIGHNGSGKSTLLRLLGGVMRPDEGRVVARARVNGLLELNTGMHPDLTGRENVIVNGVIAGLTRREVKTRLDEVVAFAELEDFVDAPVRTYSSGMRLRLGFSVAVHVDPRILLIDEVLSVGDMAFQQKCLARIRRFKEEGCAIVLITHDLSQVEAMCDRALWLRHGRVVACGEPGVVVGDYKAEMSAETRRRMPTDAPERLTSSGVTLRPHQNRFGSLEAEIRDVRLLDRHGDPTTSIGSGDPLAVEVTYAAPAGLAPPQLSVAIGGRDGGRDDCLDVNTDSDRAELPAAGGTTRIVLRLGRLDLAAGDYAVSVGLYERGWAYAYDYHWRAYPLNVSSERPSHGVLAPPRRWDIGPVGPMSPPHPTGSSRARAADLAGKEISS